jgi:hypothetical protein
MLKSWLSLAVISPDIKHYFLFDKCTVEKSTLEKILYKIGDIAIQVSHHKFGWILCSS